MRNFPCGSGWPVGLWCHCQFKLWLCYYVHLQTNTFKKVRDSLNTPSYWFNYSTTDFLQRWLWLLITHEGWYALMLHIDFWQTRLCAFQKQDVQLCHKVNKRQWKSMWIAGEELCRWGTGRKNLWASRKYTTMGVFNPKESTVCWREQSAE